MVLIYLPLVNPKSGASRSCNRLQKYVLCHINPVLSSTCDILQCNTFVYGFFSGYPELVEGSLADRVALTTSVLHG